ncbi:hypothetical protein J7K70_02895 [bacterium]|nr:hypothetical protein [bacterium]
MSEKRFKIFVTDGENIWELFFITQSGKGDFYFGSINPNFVGGKHTYHASGTRHYKSNYGKHELPKGQKLDSFRGIEHLLSYTIRKEAFNHPFSAKLYRGKKFDGSSFIDIRNYKDLIEVSPFLLEPSKLEYLREIIKVFKDSQIIIFTNASPWIVIVVYEPTREKRKFYKGKIYSETFRQYKN